MILVANHNVKLVAIVNLTPNSFSDGGQFKDPKSILPYIEKVIEDGADVIDVGAEATNPKILKSQLLTPQQEWERLENILPQIVELAHKYKVQVSIDTRHTENAAKALECDIDIINSVCGFEDIELCKIIAKKQPRVIVMHNPGLVAHEKIIAEHLDPVEVVMKWAKEKIQTLTEHGVRKDSIIIDPGIGFGKNPEQSFKLLQEAAKFTTLGVTTMFGHSRKTVFNLFSDDSFIERDFETCATSIHLALSKVDYLRIHNLKANSKSLRVFSRLFCANH